MSVNQKIILLSGFGGTGKSTVASLLHEKLESNALIEADDLFHIKPFIIGEQMGRIKLHNTLDIMSNFLNEKFEYVICVGLVWSQAELDAVIDRFGRDKIDYFLVWLTSSKEIRFRRVIDRHEPGDTLEWLENVEKTIRNPWPLKMAVGQAMAIDSGSKQPQDIVQEIMNLICQ